MAENTKISWPTHTFNPWIGCTKISPACDHCYAAAWAARFPRTRECWAGKLLPTSEANWRQPLIWNRSAADTAEPVTVFCASLCDVFDNQAPQEWRDRLWQLIEATPNLTWKLLTKRPQNIVKMLPAAWLMGDAPTNVMVGATAESQHELDKRGWHLIRIGSHLYWPTFISAEPLLGPRDFSRIAIPGDIQGEINGLTGAVRRAAVLHANGTSSMVGLELYRPFAEIITGGESGPKARLHHPAWHRQIRNDCRAAGVRYHFKQWGEWIDVDQHAGSLRGQASFVTPEGDPRDRQHARPGDALMIRAGAGAEPYLDGELHGEPAELEAAAE